MQNRVFTTKEASQITGINANTIRAWMRRCTGLFLKDIHFVISESNQKLWTEEGIALLRSRKEEPNFQAENIAESSDLPEQMNILSLLLEQESQRLALQYWQQLPFAVLERIAEMRDNPSPLDADILKSSIQKAIAMAEGHISLQPYIPFLLEEDDE